MNNLFRGVSVHTNEYVYGDCVVYSEELTVQIVQGNSIYTNSPQVEVYPYSIECNTGCTLGSKNKRRDVYTSDIIKGFYGKLKIKGPVVKSKKTQDYGIIVNKSFIPLYNISHKKLCTQIN